MMGLRLTEGIDLRNFREKYGLDLPKYFSEGVKKHLSNGNLILDQGRLKLSDQGIYVMNDILVDFM